MQNISIFKFDFPAPIWQVYPHNSYKLVLVELRNPSDRTVAYQLVDLEKQQLVWQKIDCPNDWLTSVQLFESEYLILYTYEDANKPDRLGLWVYSIQDGTLVFEHKLASFKNFAPSNRLLSYGVGNDYFETILPPIYSSNNTKSSNHLLYTPVLNIEVDKKFELICNFLKQYEKDNQIFSVEYVEAFNKMIISYVSGDITPKNLKIKVFNNLGHLLLDEPLATDLKGIVSGAYFIQSKYLVYVKQKNQLCYCCIE